MDSEGKIERAIELIEQIDSQAATIARKIEWIPNVLFSCTENEIRYNPGRIDELDPEHLAWYIRHEIEHIRRNHSERFEIYYYDLDDYDRNWVLKCFRMACELEINSDLMDDENAPEEGMYAPGLAPFEHFERGKKAEEYCDDLMYMSWDGPY